MPNLGRMARAHTFVPAVRIGTSGWSYAHWDGVLYSPGLPAARRRDVYASEFDTVELDASFYRWPRTTSFTTWGSRLPDGFVLSVKAPRTLTHARRLVDTDGYWSERFADAWAQLGDRAGPLLVQLGPDFERDDYALETFLSQLPPTLRAAVEFRHPTWNHPDVFAALTRRRAAYVITHGAGLPCVPQLTTDFTYVRFHGPSQTRLYEGSYSTKQLEAWADTLATWHEQGIPSFVYFNNDQRGYAVRNARTLRRLVGARV